MKTPAEIKKGLEYCINELYVCESCPYHEYIGLGCTRMRNEDALDYIERLEKHTRNLMEMVSESTEMAVLFAQSYMAQRRPGE